MVSMSESTHQSQPPMPVTKGPSVSRPWWACQNQPTRVSRPCLSQKAHQSAAHDEHVRINTPESVAHDEPVVRINTPESAAHDETVKISPLESIRMSLSGEPTSMSLPVWASSSVWLLSGGSTHSLTTHSSHANCKWILLQNMACMKGRWPIH